MKRRYRELSPEAKASYGTTDDPRDETWVYCDTCKRAMPQGDCVVGDAFLGCAYEDCPSRTNLAFESLYGWDAYRQGLGSAASDWPQEPEQDREYRPPGDGS